jgi:hypothetical protein
LGCCFFSFRCVVFLACKLRVPVSRNRSNQMLGMSTSFCPNTCSARVVRTNFNKSSISRSCSTAPDSILPIPSLRNLSCIASADAVCQSQESAVSGDRHTSRTDDNDSASAVDKSFRKSLFCNRKGHIASTTSKGKIGFALENKSQKTRGEIPVSVTAPLILLLLFQI